MGFVVNLAPVQLVTLTAVVLALYGAGAPESSTKAARLGAHLRVELLTMGPGTEAYSRFGHSALRITDRRGVGDIVFNFGTFDHEDPAVVSKFLAGTLRYWLSVSTYVETRKEYGGEKRRLIAQELRLTPLQRRQLFTRLYALAKPDKRNYRYHHFRANCSTKIRDVLDEVMGGELRRQLAGRPAHTYRHWLRRATRGAPLFHLGFDLVITRADGRITAWEACFAPEQLLRAMASVRVQRQGRSVPLASSTRVLLPGPDFDDDGGPTPWMVVVIVVWLLLAGAVVPLVLRPSSRWAWRVCGVMLGLWGLLSAVLSALILYIWSVTSLPVFSGNQNLVLLPPTALVWVVVGVLLVVRGRPLALSLASATPAPRPQKRWLVRWLVRGLMALSLLHALGAVIYAVARGLGFAEQGNTALVAAALPWALATVWILHRAQRIRPDRQAK